MTAACVSRRGVCERYRRALLEHCQREAGRIAAKVLPELQLSAKQGRFIDDACKVVAKIGARLN